MKYLICKLCWVALLYLLLNLQYQYVTADKEENEAPKESPAATTTSPEITYETPKPPGQYYIYEPFDYPDRYKARWIVSNAKKEDTDEDIARYNGEWELEHSRVNYLKGDLGLVLKSKAKHHAISVPLDKPFHFENSPLVVQYEVSFQNVHDCGGAYLKLLTHSSNMQLESFHDKTPYTIMFGPDKCGQDQQVHFIFRHKNPLNGSFSEKHCKRSEGKLEEIFTDKASHLFTLVVKFDNSYEIYVDQVLVNSGTLLDNFKPSVNPPEEIDDPNDRKPDGWDEREKVPDPNSKKPDEWDEEAPRQVPDPQAKKPENWLDDEPEMIPDPNAEKPEDWDDEMDGEWEPPLISNPKCEKVGCGQWNPPMVDNPEYKGKWRAPMVANPNYKGKWKPRKVSNPDYFYDKLPFRMSSIGAVGFELWSMSSDILFDNILITNDKYVADAIAAKTWELKNQLAQRDSESLFKRIISYTNNRPWLWAVYVVVIGLPLVIIVVFCCSSNEEKPDKAAAARAKKTDAVTPDDQPLTSQPVSEGHPRSTIEEIISKSADEKQKASEKNKETLNDSEHKAKVKEEREKEENITKGDLNTKPEDDEVEAEEEDEEEEEVEEDEEEEEEADADEVNGLASGDSADQSPRKRKPRKD